MTMSKVQRGHHLSEKDPNEEPLMMPPDEVVLLRGQLMGFNSLLIKNYLIENGLTQLPDFEFKDHITVRAWVPESLTDDRGTHKVWIEHGIRADVPSLLLAIEKKAQFIDPTAPQEVYDGGAEGEAEGEAEQTPKPTRRRRSTAKKS